MGGIVRGTPLYIVDLFGLPWVDNLRDLTPGDFFCVDMSQP